MRKKWLTLLIVLCLVGIAIAATVKVTYQSAQSAAATDGYSGGTSDLAADQAYDYTSDVDMETNGYFGIWIWLEHDSSGTTDDIIFAYFSSPDGTDFDDVAVFGPIQVDSDGSDDQIGWYIANPPPHGRFGVKTSGTTDTYDYRIRYRGVRGDAS